MTGLLDLFALQRDHLLPVIFEQLRIEDARVAMPHARYVMCRGRRCWCLDLLKAAGRAADGAVVRWFRDRGGYGELRLPVDRRRQRSDSWLGRDLRARRRELLRTRWLDLVKIVGAFGVAAASLALTARGMPLLQAAVIGGFVGAIVVAGVVVLLWPMALCWHGWGRMFEGDVGDALRTTRGVFGVISGVPFEGFDVDHVVLAPKGCYAVEVKALFGRRQRLDDTYHLAAKASQAHRGASKVQRLLRSRGVDLTVTPVLVLAGPGAPIIEGVVHVDGVLVATFRNSDGWRACMAAPGRSMDAATARRAAEKLLAFTEERSAYERSNQAHRPPHAPHS